MIRGASTTTLNDADLDSLIVNLGGSVARVELLASAGLGCGAGSEGETPRHLSGGAQFRLKLRGQELVGYPVDLNVDALRFYQARGFVIREVRVNAVDASRRLKPEIPATGAYGLPIRDEIELGRGI